MLFIQATPQPGTPIIVKVIEVPTHTLGDVVMAALGISGLMLIGAVILGLVLGVGFIAFRIRRRRRQPIDSPTDHQQLHLRA